MRDGGDYFIRIFRNENNEEVGFHGSCLGIAPKIHTLFLYILHFVKKEKFFNIFFMIQERPNSNYILSDLYFNIFREMLI